jgi:hypothetical protein
VSRDSNARGQATAGAKDSDGSDSLSRATAARGPDDLAAEFLEAIVGRPETWQELLLPWAADHGVTVDQLKALQREIIRQRVFGAVKSHRSRRRR